ncbi:MAG: hypothetical protein PHU85_12405, partial [Phycisphaerae bacterium]|nr:hypothetical protein [Phycisphaerae bacterium]
MKNRVTLLAVAAILALFVPAAAVIKIELPVSKTFDMSRSVVVGTVTKVNPDNRVAEVKVADVAKGESVGETFRVQVTAPADLFGKVAADQPIVLFVSKARNGTVAVLHLADTWVLADLVPNSNPPAWRVGQVHDLKQSFPGRTAALARIVGEMKAGKSTLLNEAEPNYFGEAKKIGNLGMKNPTWIMPVDIDKDNREELLVAAAGAARLFARSDNGYADVTEKWGGPWPAVGAAHAAGEVSGHVDLLLGNTLLLNDGKKVGAKKIEFAKVDAKDLLAVALVDVNGDKKPDAVFVSAGGLLQVAINPGDLAAEWKLQPGKPLWADGQAAWASVGDWGDD